MGIVNNGGSTVAAAMPAGVTLPYAGAGVPTGYLLCDGSAVSRTVYAVLYSSIGVTYGAGNGTTTFNIPDTRGIFIRGSGVQTVGGVTYSVATGDKLGDQMQGHIHQEYGSNNGVVGGGFVGGPSTANALLGSYTSSPVSDGTNGTPRAGAETRPAFVAFNHIIKF